MAAGASWRRRSTSRFQGVLASASIVAAARLPLRVLRGGPQSSLPKPLYGRDGGRRTRPADEDMMIFNQLASLRDLPQRSKLGFVCWARKDSLARGKLAGWQLVYNSACQGRRQQVPLFLAAALVHVRSVRLGRPARSSTPAGRRLQDRWGQRSSAPSCGGDGPQRGSLPGSGLLAPAWAAAELRGYVT